jgi:hypothetical protein
MSEQPGEVPVSVDERTELEAKIKHAEFMFRCLTEHQAKLSHKLSMNNAILEKKADELYELRNRLGELK